MTKYVFLFIALVLIVGLLGKGTFNSMDGTLNKLLNAELVQATNDIAQLRKDLEEMDRERRTHFHNGMFGKAVYGR